MINILMEEIGASITLKQGVLEALNRLKIYTLRDLIFFRPATYKIKHVGANLSALKDGEQIQVEIIIKEILWPTSKKQPLKIAVSNSSGNLLLIFFNKIPPFILNQLKVGSKHTISGKVQYFDYYFQITHPEFLFNNDEQSAIEVIYPLTYGLVNKQLRSYITRGLDKIENLIQRLSTSLNRKGESELEIFLQEMLKDLKQLHLYKVSFSENEVESNFEKARINLAKKELLANQISLSNLRRQKTVTKGKSLKIFKSKQEEILKHLNFTLTTSQNNVINEIEEDQKSEAQMMRLLQGDVGAGKTLVALLTILNVAYNNLQSALMAPTDLLANQHYNFFKEALKNTSIKVKILTGNTSLKERKLIYQELEEGEISILIGTHALFQEKVNFKNLSYVVIDEQHRFGVEQRLNLINKSSNPDVLVMTATPIPRSLTLTMFGDMPVSKLTCKPQGRLPIITTSAAISRVEEVMGALDRKILQGEKIYWICSLVDSKDDDSDYNEIDALSRYQILENIYPGKVGLAHGKMKGAVKEEAMQQFKNGDINILVATTVIEVGIDVKEATLIVIENAERFGLSQLHQLRGRVGRGDKQSYCMLLFNPKRLSYEAKQRLEVMRRSNDGFYIAEQDLILRGSGEILGTKQSGEPEFFFANLAKDLELLLEANKMAASREMTDSIKFQIKLFAKKEACVITSG